MANTTTAIKGKTVLLAIAAWIVGGALIFALGPYQSVKNTAAGSMPEEQFFGAPDQIAAQINQIAAQRQQAYLIVQGIDVLNAALTTLAFLCIYRFLISRLLAPRKGSRTRLTPLLLLPLLLFALDLLENVAIVISVLASPDPSPVLTLMIWSTTLKLLAGIIMMLTALVLALAWVGKGLMSRRARAAQDTETRPSASEA